MPAQLMLGNLLVQYAAGDLTLDFGKDTGLWNRGKLMGANQLIRAIGEINPEMMLEVLQTVPADVFLRFMNDDRTADAIRIR